MHMLNPKWSHFRGEFCNIKLSLVVSFQGPRLKGVHLYAYKLFPGAYTHEKAEN